MPLFGMIEKKSTCAAPSRWTEIVSGSHHSGYYAGEEEKVIEGERERSERRKWKYETEVHWRANRRGNV